MKPQARGRTPDWELRFLNKDTDERGQVGAAWTNDDGSIRIKLNPLVQLRSGAECIYTLFAWTRTGEKRQDVKLTQEEMDSLPF